ncbi:MAG: WYL domain-containing protein [Lachnospiraceae bacterium]|nr:WYL domain-containing protein [Lachnospiraceae bacterium]
MVELYHLVFQWLSWYVWGYCTQCEDYRTFHLTRMTKPVLTDGKIQQNWKIRY